LFISTEKTIIFAASKSVSMLVIFDLDGTLLNSLEDLCDSCNHTLSQHHFPTHPLDDYRYFVGDGMWKLIERVLPENARNEETMESVYNDFLSYYQEHKTDKTAPYAGMVETLETLQANGVKIAVASNKAHEAMDELMSHYFPTIHFAAALGKRPGVPTKPAPDIVFDILKITEAAPDETWYVGDTATDMATATNAGLRKIGVLWGFRDRTELENAAADVIIEKPADLVGVVLPNKWEKRREHLKEVATNIIKKVSDDEIPHTHKEPKACLNCGTLCDSDYCPTCGQSTDEHRLSIKNMWKNLMAGIIGNDGGVIYTLKRLFTRPWKVVKDYIDGRRVNYFSPFPMLLVISGLYLLIINQTHSNQLMITDSDESKNVSEQMEIQRGELDETSYIMAAEGAQAIVKAKEFYANHYALITILTLPISVSFIRLFYGKKFRKRYNWAETTVLQIYFIILATIIECILSVVYWFSHDIYESIYDYFIIFGYPAILTWCSYKLLEKRIIRQYITNFLVLFSGGIFILILLVVLLIGVMAATAYKMGV